MVEASELLKLKGVFVALANLSLRITGNQLDMVEFRSDYNVIVIRSYRAYPCHAGWAASVRPMVEPVDRSSW